MLQILLADSNEVSRALVAHLLEEQGHIVSMAADGVEAIRASQDADPREFDLLLVDTAMPTINGLEVARAIRQMEGVRGGRLSIIAMGSAGTSAEEEACRAAGVDAYLAKPLCASALLGSLACLSTRSAASDPEASRSQAVFDKTAFLSRLDGDEALAREIVEMFLKEYPKLLENVHRAAQQSNPSLLERAAHSLKGSVGDMSAPQAFEAAHVLEQSARESKLDALDAMLSTLDLAVHRLGDELRSLEKTPA